MGNSVWKIQYEEQPSNDKSTFGHELTVAAKTAEAAIEKARTYSMRKSNWWYASDKNGNDTKKKVTIVAFILTSVNLVTTIDL